MIYQDIERVDFSSGLKSSVLDKNFSILNEKWRYSLLNTIGYGVIDGLELETLRIREVNKVKLTSGRFINKDGIIKKVEEKILNVDPLNPFVIEDKEYEVDNEGNIRLDYIPYNPHGQSYLSMGDLNKLYDNPPITVQEKLSGVEIGIMSLSGHNLIVPIKYADAVVRVTHNFICDRIDAVVIDNDGKVSILKGVESASPSKVELSNYNDRILLGFIRVYVDYPNRIELINYKTITNLYTNKNNDLFLKGTDLSDILNGVIHFVEPKQPIRDNTLWLDSNDNQLKIWQNGAWRDVNTVKTELIRKVVRWERSENPEDLQTYYFPKLREGRPYIIFLQEQVEIVMDNTPLMHDQFELIYKDNNPDEYNCLGFKLKAPMEKPSFVETRLYLTAKEEPLHIVHRKYSAYTIENSIIQVLEKFPDRDISIDDEYYTIGEHQLELYLDGKKLAHNIDFVELNEKSQPADNGDKGNKSNKFRIFNTTQINEDSILVYKIIKTIYAYDHINKIMDKFEKQMSDIELEMNNLKSKSHVTDEYVDAIISSLNTAIGSVQEAIGIIAEGYLSIHDRISYEQFDKDTLKKLHHGKIDLTLNQLDSVVELPITPNDYVSVIYIDKNKIYDNKVLVEGAGYELESNTTQSSFFKLEPHLINDRFYIKINGIKL